ncbi:MAG: Ig-like domain-containing protein [Deltaproteobacteria bacterium]|nr:Ig-like domain-containing protein [Deltaproteobacteria bacterium]
MDARRGRLLRAALFLALLFAVLAVAPACTCNEEDDHAGDENDLGDLPAVDDDTDEAADDDTAADDDDVVDDDDTGADDDTGDDDAEIVSLSIDPEERWIPTGVMRTFIATAHYDNDDTATDLPFVFSSSNPDVVFVDNAGRAIGFSHGEADVTVTLGDLSATASVTVGAYVFYYDGIGATLGAYDVDGGTAADDYLAAKDAVADVPAGLAIVDGVAYVVESGDFAPGTVGTEGLVVVDLSTKETSTMTVADLDNPWAVDIPNGVAYITGNLSDNLAALDLSTGDAELVDLPADCVPTDVKAIGDKVYVACSGYDSGTFSYADPGVLAVVDFSTDASVDTVDLSQVNPTSLVPSLDGNFLFVVCTGNYSDEFGYVDVIDLSNDTVVDGVDLGSAPGSMVIHPNRTAFVADNFSGSVMTFDTVTLDAGPSVALTDAFWVATVAVDPFTGLVLAGAWDGAKIWSIDPFALETVGSVGASNVSSLAVWAE